MTVAIVVATAPAREGGPAAGLRWEAGTVLGRLVEQLGSLGVRRVHVVTRPGWAELIEPTGLPVRLHVASDPVEDVALIARLAAATRMPVVLLHGEIVTHREALAGLLADPRVVTGILCGRARRRAVFRTRSARGRVVSAGSAYHQVRRGNGSFLGVLKVGPRDAGALAAAAQELGQLLRQVPAPLELELQRKAEGWRDRLREDAAEAVPESWPDRTPDHERDLVAGPTAGRGSNSSARHAERVAAAADEHGLGDRGDLLDPSELLDSSDRAELRGLPPLNPEGEAEIQHTVDVARQDVVALLLVGLVRGGVHVTNSYLRRLFWARPLTQPAADAAAVRILDFDEDRVLLESAVKANDGFFTTYFVSPYSKYVARWAARRGLTPNQVTTLSMGMGGLAALAFATGSRRGMVGGAVLLQVAFSADCVDGQLARYTRTFSKLGAWLDSVFDRAKEYVVFAGLAAGSARGFGDDVWALAAAAMTLQTARHLSDFSYAATQHSAMATAPRLPLTTPYDGPTAPAARDRPAVLPTTPAPEQATAPAPSPLLVAAPAEPVEPTAPLPRRLLGALARQGIAASRALERRPWTRWAKKILVFPIGERFAVISLAAALTTPRRTFLIVLGWGTVAATYAVAGRTLRSLAQ